MMQRIVRFFFKCSDKLIIVCEEWSYWANAGVVGFREELAQQLKQQFHAFILFLQFNGSRVQPLLF